MVVTVLLRYCYGIVTVLLRYCYGIAKSEDGVYDWLKSGFSFDKDAEAPPPPPPNLDRLSLTIGCLNTFLQHNLSTIVQFPCKTH